MSNPPDIVIDTNIFINAFVRGKELRCESSVRLIERVHEGKINLLIPAPILCEVFIVVAREKLNPKDGLETVANILSEPTVHCLDVKELHARASNHYMEQCNYEEMIKLPGKYKTKHPDYCLSYTDGLVLAVGKGIPGCVVCSEDREMFNWAGITTMRPKEYLKKYGLA